MSTEYYYDPEDEQDTSTNDEVEDTNDSREDDPADVGSIEQTIEDYGKYGEDRTNDNSSLYN